MAERQRNDSVGCLGTLPPDELHVMSFNLRFAADEAPHAWAERRPEVSRLLRSERAHLLGTQEGLPAQLADILADLGPQHRSIGCPRQAGPSGEAMQVFFDARRLEALQHNHFWLSETPEVPGSASWSPRPRMATCVRFRDRLTGAVFWLANTHLQACHEQARARSATLIRTRLAAVADDPVVLTGDWNEPAGASPVYDTLVTGGPYADTWLTGRQVSPAWGTFTDFGPPVVGGDRIDWILASPDIEVGAVAMGPYDPDRAQPSDHLPVHAALRIPPR